ncbi:MAG: hypothetical protein GY859_10670 [Desulfobacterales bacterium]|nr:hypothetical protein [Desulfobacterales bacterium]
MFRLFKAGALWSLAPLAISCRTGVTAETGKIRYSPDKGPDLREIAEGKIHHGAGAYLNPFNNGVQGGFWRVASWKLLHKNHFKGFYNQERVRRISIDWKPLREHSGLSVTFLRHASLLIKDAGVSILIDPIFFEISRFIKDFTPLDFNVKEMPGPDHILITHGHYDHLDKASLALFDKETHVISPLGYDDVFNDLKMRRRDQLDWFETYQEGPLEITLLPCNHWTMRNPLRGPNDSLWGSYLIKTSGGYTILVMGDTGYFDGFKEIGASFDIDLVIFNLSAYEPRWFMAPSHMNPAETVRAFEELNARRLSIVHWGTFRLGDEPVHFPPIQLRRELERKGLEDRLLQLDHGRTLFPGCAPPPIPS